jgi:hypothetical protein
MSAATERMDFAAGAVAERITASRLYLLSSSIPDSPHIHDLEFVPYGRKDIAAFRLELPFSWNEDPYHDRNWCGQLHMWRMLDGYLLRFEKTGDSAWLDIPVLVISDWHRFHFTAGGRAIHSWKDMMVGLRAMKLAFIVSQWQHGRLALTPEQVEMLRHLVRRHLAFLLNMSKVTLSNHTLADLHGVAALAHVMNAKSAAIIHAFIDDVLPRCVRAQFDRRGVHLEHSPAYHPFAIGFLKRLDQSGWFDKHRLHDIAERASRVSNWFRLPDGRIAPVGDTTGSRPKEPADTAFKGQRQSFNSSGYAIIRDDGGGKSAAASYFMLMGAYHSQFHKHQDDLSVLWFDGEDILCDAGKYAYKNDKFQDYVVSTAAHNTIEIDSANFRPGSQVNDVPYGSAIENLSVHGWGFLVSAQVHHPLTDVRHIRHCLYQPGQWLLVVDKLLSQALHTVVQWFHLSPDLHLSEEEGPKLATLPSSGRVLSMHHAGIDSEPMRTMGATEPRLQGWISRGYGSVEPNLALGHVQRGSNLLFATLFTLDERESSLEITRDGSIRVALQTPSAQETFELHLDAVNCKVRELVD